jgi:hypothetical protein
MVIIEIPAAENCAREEIVCGAGAAIGLQNRFFF